ncbi:restriction endonuclease subunit S [Rhodococcus opacus]|uniref:restriction endonuclease subunit S n=1 Tax=Rhodococcus opacus TaxID=37919 RepID=UPI00155A3827
MNSSYAKGYWRATCSTSSGLNTINSRQLKSMSVAIPPRSEQERIAAVLAVVNDRVDSERRELEKLRRQKQGLMSDLLNGRVRVPQEAGS